MNIKNQLSIFFLFFWFLVSGQDEQAHDVIQNNNIAKIEAYVFREMDTQDSSLLTIEYFNKSGRRVKIEIYDSTGITNSYEYVYDYDTLQTARNTYYRNELRSVTKVINDEFGKPIKYEDYDAEGKMTGTHAELKYDQKHHLIEQMTVFNYNFFRIEKFKLDDNGKILKVHMVTANGRKLVKKYHTTGNVFTESSPSSSVRKETIYDAKTGYRIEKVTILEKRKTEIIGTGGRLKLNAGDKLLTERYFLKNGLLAREIEYRNKQFIASKKFNYFLW